MLGFDYFFGIAASNNMPPYCFIENERVVGRPSVMKHPLNTGNTKAPMVAGWDDSQYGPNFTEKAIAFLEQALVIGREIKDPWIVSFCSEQLEKLRQS